MDEKIRKLLYTTKDGRSIWDAGYVDQLEWEEEDIDFDRIPEIRKLLIPNAKKEDLRVPFEAALVLTSWGDEKGLEYLEYIVNLPQEDLCGFGYSHRLRNYDTTFEWIANAAIAFAAFQTNYEEFDARSKRIFSLLAKILKLCETHQFEFPFFQWILRRDYREYDEGLRSYLKAVLSNEEFHHHKPSDAVKFFAEYDPKFLDKTLSEFGKRRSDYL